MSKRLKHLVIRASAGSGKTFQLSNRYLSLVARDVPLDSILATTFTRKAAGEIQDRVLLRLAQATLTARDRDALQGFLDVGELARERCLKLLAAMAHNLHRLRIGTLDSFFIQAAQGLALELGLPAGWRIVDEVEDNRLREEAIAAVLSRGEHGELGRLVNLLTKGDAQRSVAELIRDTVQQLYGVFVETPAEAWEKIPSRSRLEPMELDQAIRELAAATIPAHANATKARQKDLDNALRGDWETFPRDGLAKHVASGKTEYSGKAFTEELRALYHRLLEHAWAEILRTIRSQTIATRDLLQRFHEQYQRLKQTRRGLRFEDVTRRVGEYLSADGPAGTGSEQRLAQLAFRLDARIDHLLLDEFQDTSLAQWNVLRPLAVQVTAPRAERSFFCVGDGKQAIYGWRGGIAEIFEALNRQLTGLTDDSLDESHRSAPAVIDVVNQVFRNLTRHKELDRSEQAVRRWCEKFPTHSTAKKSYPGYVTLETGPGEDDEDGETLLPMVAARVRDLVSQAPGRKIGVLVRTNATVAHLIHELRKLEVPASEEGGNPLTDSAAVQLILSLLELADHPGNRVARFHVAESHLGPLVRAPQLDADDAWASLASELRRKLLSDGYGATIESWARGLALHCDPREWRRLGQLVAMAYRYESAATLRPRDFVEVVSARRVADPSTADVTVTTVHKSKGLQYDIVVLPELDKNILGQSDAFVVGRPDPISPIDRVCRYVSVELRPGLPKALQELFEEADDQDTTESLSVLYVALTRAIYALHMIIAAPKKSEKKLPKTFAGLLRAALCDDAAPPAPRTVVFAHGNPDWYREAASATAPAGPGAEAASEPARSVTLAPVTGARRRGLHRVAPSALEGGHRVTLAVPSAADGALGRQRGLLFHAWLEEVQWREEGIPDEATLVRIASKVLDRPLPPAVLEEARREFRTLFDHERLTAIWSREDYRRELLRASWPTSVAADLQVGQLTLHVRNEHPFALRDGDRLVTGVIDRLVTVQAGDRTLIADLLDYKTDAAASPKEIQAKVEYYRPQLLAYRAAVAQLLRLPEPQVRARLVLLQARQIVTM